MSQDSRLNVGTSAVNIAVAHAWEASALLQSMKLGRVADTLLPIYSDGKVVNLIITGMGKINAASAVAYLAGLLGNNARNHAWLNVGIAGHQSLGTGSGLVSQKITSASDGRVMYPSLLLNHDQQLSQEPSISFSDLVTVDTVETKYPEAAAYDMEAAAFYETALRFSCLELIQCYKVVSDGPAHSLDAINKGQVIQWVSANSRNVMLLVEKLKELSETFSENYGDANPAKQDVQKLLSRLRFSATQQKQLQRYCQRYYALGGKDLLNKIDAEKNVSKDSRQLLSWFAQLLDSGA